ncbi:hypothetical protein [Streptomyces luteireticuli]|uniref:Zinc ribbon domain-containing protein n=1 Tax=Streptomyces luteireticuli TaxID=173858 RepID=A0ABN0YX55_9ACTN
MRIIPLHGTGTTLFKCPVPTCALVLLPTALAEHGRCPGCDHDRLVRLDLADSTPSAPSASAPDEARR